MWLESPSQNEGTPVSSSFGTLSPLTCSTSTDPSPAKNAGSPCSPQSDCGNPINVGVGNKHQRELDYIGAGEFPLKIERTYNSIISGAHSMGAGWTGNYSRSILYLSGGGLAYLNRGDGKTYTFTQASANQPWLADADVNGVLASQGVDASGNPTGWSFTNPENEVETYNAAGQLLSIVNHSGLQHTLTYSCTKCTSPTPSTIAPIPGLLLNVTDTFNRQLNFYYDANAHLVKITDPAGQNYLYSYSNGSSSANLQSVTYPDNSKRSYRYNEAAYVTAGASSTNLLTGIIDENGQRYATWTYDANNRATGSWHGDTLAAEKISVSYTTDATGNPLSSAITDALNTTRTYNFSTNLSVTRNTGITGQPCKGCFQALSYDANGNPTSQIDFNGNLTCFNYDQTRNLELYRVEGLPSGSSCPVNLAAFTPAAGSSARLIATQWLPNYRLPSLFTQSGQSISFNYDAVGNLLSKTLTDTSSSATPQPSRTWTYTYNTRGQVLTEDGPRTDVSDITTYSYYTTASATAGAMHQPGDLQSVINALGHTTNYTNFDANGRLLSLTDPNGLVISLSYDLRGRLTSKTVGGNTTAYTYDAVGNLIKVTDPMGVAVTYTYDAAHRLTDITDALGGKIHYTLDGMDNPTQEQIFTAAGTLVNSKSRVFDALSRLQKDLDAYNNTTAYQYDANGNLTQITDANQNIRKRSYDALNRLSTETDALNDITRYQYNALDRVTLITDAANHSTAYSYNGFGDRLTESSPNTGLTQYQYNSAGYLAQSIDAQNVPSYYDYDALNRLSAITTPKSSPVAGVNYYYDGAPKGIPNQLGRLTYSERGSPYSYNYYYDLQGNLIRSIAYGLAHPGVGNSVYYSYDAANRLTETNIANYRYLMYQYDTVGQVKQITVQDQDKGQFSTNGYNVTRTLVNNVNRLPFGPVNHLSYCNGLSLSRSYDQNYRLSGQTVGTQQNLNYSYDPVGNLKAANDLITAANSISYAYDPVKQLLSASGANSFTYTYDAVGNRQTDYKNTAQTQYNYDLNSQKLLTQTGARPNALVTDANGNITQSNGKTYNYDPDRRLGSVTQGGSTLASYQYDSFGRRVSKTTPSGTTNFDYDLQGHLLQESGPALAATYVYLDNEPLARVDYNLSDTTGNINAWNIAYYHNNPVGAPIQTTDRLGNVSWTGQLDPFGNVLPINPSITQNLRFPGQYYDAETGLHYNGQRYYDQLSGRYLQSDRIGLAGGINTYTYVNNNPVNLTDSSGLIVDTITDLVSLGLSYQAYKDDPSLANGLGLAYDALATALPGLPAGIGIIKSVGKKASSLPNCPANFSPNGAKRSGAFNEAKRQSGIPTSQQPSKVLPNTDKRGNPQPGRIYEYEVPAKGGGTDTVTIRDDAGGHDFGPGDPQNRGPHFNDEAGNHYDY